MNVAAMAWQAEAAQLRQELHALKAQLAEKETLEARRQEPKARIAAQTIERTPFAPVLRAKTCFSKREMMKDASLSSKIGVSSLLAAPSEVIDRAVPAAALISEETLRQLAAQGATGVAIISCRRPKYLQRAMDSILRAPREPAKFPLIISQDAHDAAMQEATRIKAKRRKGDGDR